MLVLTISDDGVVHIGDDIEVKVIWTRKGKTQLGITAPAGVKILRDELLDKIEQREASLKPVGVIKF